MNNIEKQNLLISTLVKGTYVQFTTSRVRARSFNENDINSFSTPILFLGSTHILVVEGLTIYNGNTHFICSYQGFRTRKIVVIRAIEFVNQDFKYRQVVHPYKWIKKENLLINNIVETPFNWGWGFGEVEESDNVQSTVYNVQEMKENYQKNKSKSIGEHMYCPFCGESVIKKTYNKIFCSTDHKEKYWNNVRY
jgi:hypothetical protein